MGCPVFESPGNIMEYNGIRLSDSLQDGGEERTIGRYRSYVWGRGGEGENDWEVEK